MSSLSLENTEKHHRTIGWLIIACLLFLRIGVLGIIGTFTHPVWLEPFFEVSTYLGTAIIIWWERDHLEEFHIDGIALILILVLKPVETLLLSHFWKIDTPLTFPHPLSFALWIIPLVLLISLAFSKFKFPKIRINILVWILIGIISGFLTILLTAYPMSFYDIDLSRLPYTLKQFYTDLSPYVFIWQGGYAGVTEEPLFRGLLWGYLLKAGISNWKILLIQTFLFTLSHLYFLRTDPINFFIGVPIAATVLGLLAWKSRSIATSIAAHSTMNSIGWQVILIYATLRMK
jgi:membrane protease YdiL (CAAX protease family)